MTNRELINEMKQQSRAINAMKAKTAYRLLANELLIQIPGATIVRTKPMDLLEEGLPTNPELLDNYNGTDLFYYHFAALLPDGRLVRIRADSSLERFRVFRLYWLAFKREVNMDPAGYRRDEHMAVDSMVCNRSNSSLKATINKLALREPSNNDHIFVCRAPTAREMQQYLDDQYNNL
ncbi:MAG: hypothetical protein EBU46_00250 [Nitrosomonadaceae bacterium]|nr:hypothetical protein [Nitrosomonadaceae bacterium]